MQRQDLLVMSGTGNSLRLARWMAQEGECREIPSEIHLYPPEHLERESILGVLGPTHGFTAPWALIRTVTRLPKGEGRAAYVLCSRAGIHLGVWHPPGIAGSAFLILALLLWLRGYRVRGGMSVNMPSNWMSLHPALSPKSFQAVHEHAHPRVIAFAKQILGGRRYWWSRNLLYEGSLGLLLSPISLGYLLMGRFFLARLFFYNSRCNACGLCARSCPVGALKMRALGTQKRPFWTLSCESCMRCMAYCPPKAIEVGHSWGLLLNLLWLLPLGWLWSDSLSLGSLLWFFLCLVLFYPLFHRALMIPWINTLFSYTTLTRWYRRAHDPEVRLRDLLPRRSGRP